MPFTSVFEYFHYLKSISSLLHPFGPQAIIYLAAAVSDFYVHRDDMSEHKIQSSASLCPHFRHTPKMVLPLTQVWAPSAFTVTFKVRWGGGGGLCCHLVGSRVWAGEEVDCVFDLFIRYIWCACVCLCMVCVCVCACVCIFIYTQALMSTQLCAHGCTYKWLLHIYSIGYTHTHTHTHCACAQKVP